MGVDLFRELEFCWTSQNTHPEIDQRGESLCPREILVKEELHDKYGLLNTRMQAALQVDAVPEKRSEKTEC